MAKTTNEQSKPTMEQTLNNQEAFFLKYRNPILIAVAVIIVAVAGFVCYKQFVSGPREEKAATALAKPQSTFAEALSMPNDSANAKARQDMFLKALNGDKGTEGFLAIADNYSFTDAANLANLYAGLCYAHIDKWDEALKYLDAYSTKSDAFISPAAVAALADANANKDDLDKAVSKFKEAASMADKQAADGVNISISPLFLMKAARLLEEQKKNDEALEIYKEIKEKYVNSPSANDIDKYIERLSK